MSKYVDFCHTCMFLGSCLWYSGHSMNATWICVCVCLIAQSCLTLCDPLDCSPPGISVRGILQARILEWVAVSSSRGSSQPRDGTPVTCLGRRLGRDLGTSLGALKALGNSVVMKPPVRKPRGQSSLFALPLLSLLCSVETVSYKFCRKELSPWWGLWAPGHEPLPSAVSLFPLLS